MVKNMEEEIEIDLWNTIKKKSVAVSGGFDPLHVGHLRMFQEARKLGDSLTVILNDDNFLLKKKGYIFMPENERKEIIQAYEFVDDVYIHHPTNKNDLTVCEALKNLRPSIFANGGDRLRTSTPEESLCERLDIETAYNVGGGKEQSSSWMVGNARKSIDGLLKEYRPWGNYEVLDVGHGYQVKRLYVDPHKKLSLQSHMERDEHWVISKGTATVQVNDNKYIIPEGQHVYIPRRNKHRIENESDNPLIIIETQLGNYLGEDDIIRYEDDFGRV